MRGVADAQQTGAVPAALEVEVRVLLRLVGQEVEEVPLRHEGHEPTVRRQPPEVDETVDFTVDAEAQFRHLGVRQGPR